MARSRATGIKITEGYLYVLQSPILPRHAYKVGMTTKDPYERAKEVQSQFELPEPFHIVRIVPTDNVYKLEGRVHRALDRHRARSGEPILSYYNLRRCTELFQNLTLTEVDAAISRACEDMDIDDSWCRRLQQNPDRISKINGVGNSLKSNDPNIREWIRRLCINGNQPVTEFTLRQIASGVPDNAGKTTYLYWRFQGAPRIWFDPTQPKNASTFIHRRFKTSNSTDEEVWNERLGEDAIWYKYRNETELRMVLWKEKHFGQAEFVISRVLPNSEFLF